MKRKLLSIILSIAITVSFMPVQTYYASAKVKTKATVSTQAGLKKAFKNKSLKTLTIKTSKAKTFTIPTVKHKQVKLVLNAPNGKVKIPKKAKVNELTVKSDKIRLEINNNSISKIKVDADTMIEIAGSTTNPIEIILADGVTVSVVNGTKTANINLKNSQGEEVGVIKAGNEGKIAIDEKGNKIGNESDESIGSGGSSAGGGKSKDKGRKEDSKKDGDSSADASKTDDKDKPSEEEKKPSEEEKKPEQSKEKVTPEPEQRSDTQTPPLSQK